MPLYEFRCLKCNEIFELLLTNVDEKVEMKCPHCGSEDFERILSSTSYAIGVGKGESARPSVESRECASGTCSTITLPGHSKT